jgi:hypothetical protein
MFLSNSTPKSKLRMGRFRPVDPNAGKRRRNTRARKDALRAERREEHKIMTTIFHVPRRWNGNKLGLRRRKLLWQGK